MWLQSAAHRFVVGVLRFCMGEKVIFQSIISWYCLRNVINAQHHTFWKSFAKKEQRKIGNEWQNTRNCVCTAVRYLSRCYLMMTFKNYANIYHNLVGIVVATCVGSTILLCGKGSFPQTSTEWYFYTEVAVWSFRNTLLDIGTQTGRSGSSALWTDLQKYYCICDGPQLILVCHLMVKELDFIVFLHNFAWTIERHEEKPRVVPFCRDRCFWVSAFSFNKHPSHVIE